MPRFQGSLETVANSRDWARANRRDVFGPNVEAIRRAYTDAGRAVPAQYAERAAGGRDVVPEVAK
jgi:limonene 1,2-monooxygenase